MQRIIHSRMIAPGPPGEGMDPGQVAEIEEAIAPVQALAEGEVLTATASGRVGWDNKVFDASHPRWGIAGNNSTDDTAALQAMADACEEADGRFLIPAHMRCRITSTLDLRYIPCVDVQGQITVAHTTGVGVIVGNSAGTREPTIINLDRVRHAGSQSNICVRVIGIKNGKVTINRSEYVQLYANAGVPADDSIAYSRFRLGEVTKLELYGVTSSSWINQNYFNADRVQQLIIGTSGGYAHNCNQFYDMNLENSTITVNSGHSNRIWGRFEGTCTATFGTGTHSNRIYQVWEGVQSGTFPSVTWTDNGFDNRVVLEKFSIPAVTVHAIDAGSRTTDTTSAWITPHATRRIRPGFRKVQAPNGLTDYADTGMVPVYTTGRATNEEGGSHLRILRFASDAAIWRLKVFCYDSDRQPLDGSSTSYISASGGWIWSGPQNAYILSTDRDFARIVVTHPDVAYIRVRFYAGSAGWFTFAKLVALLTAPYDDQFVDQIRRQMARPLYQASTTPPTQSLLYPGDEIGTDTGRLVLTHRVDTTLASGASSSATTVTLTGATGINDGDTIAILLDDDTTHFTTVSGAPSGNDVTLAAGLPSSAASGNQVATQRWLHIT